MVSLGILDEGEILRWHVVNDGALHAPMPLVVMVVLR